MQQLAGEPQLRRAQSGKERQKQFQVSEQA
jgi:hypothetical protein